MFKFKCKQNIKDIIDVFAAAWALLLNLKPIFAVNKYLQLNIDK